MLFGYMDPAAVFTFMMGNDATDMLTFITDHVTAKQGLKHFRSTGIEAIMKELEQLIYRKVMEGCHARQLSTTEKRPPYTTSCF